MNSTKTPSVAVLLATYNGARYIPAQLCSLRDNRTHFALHWLDDHSTDGTRDAVRASAGDCGIELRECHQPDHLGVPRSYFRLLELVEADIYLFCDQDDIWQPNKLDATVDSLLPQLGNPALSFTDYTIFEDTQPGIFIDQRPPAHKKALSKAISESVIYAFLPGGPSAQTQGFTKPLRDLYVKHRQTALNHAAMHDWWMYDIATACGSVTRLEDAPKVLYRRHANSFCATLFQTSNRQAFISWRRNQLLRQIIARHARGLLLAAPTLPTGDGLNRMLQYARLASAIDTRQSLASALRLSRLGIKSMSSPISMLFSCVLSSASDTLLEKEARAIGLLSSSTSKSPGSA